MKDRGFWVFYDLLAIFFAGCLVLFSERQRIFGFYDLLAILGCLVLFWFCGAVALGALYRPEAQKGWPCSFAERARFFVVRTASAQRGADIATAKGALCVFFDGPPIFF